MKSKILLVCNFYPNKYKPYEGVFFRYHAYTLSRIFKVRVQTLIRLDRFGYERWKDGEVEVEAFIMPYRVGFGFIFLPLAVFLHFLLALKNLIFFRPKRVVLHMGLPQGLALLWFFKGFYVVEHSDRIWSGINRFLSFPVFKSARKVAGLSSWQVEELRGKFFLEPFILGNPLENRGVVKGGYPKLVVFVGTIAPNKDPIVVLESAKILKDFFFIFVGRNFGDEYFSYFLEKLKSLNNAIYLGPLSHQRTMNILKCAGILVSTSLRETFGYTIAEALAMGKPVVWFDSGGPKDFLNEENSVLVKNRDPVSLAEGILKCYEKIKKGEFDRKRMRDNILSRYSYEEVLKRYLEFLDLTDLQGD